MVFVRGLPLCLDRRQEIVSSFECVIQRVKDLFDQLQPFTTGLDQRIREPSRLSDTAAKDCFVGKKNHQRAKNVRTRTHTTRESMSKASKDDSLVPRLVTPGNFA